MVNYQQNSYLAVIGVHSTMHPNYCQINIMCVCVCVCACVWNGFEDFNHNMTNENLVNDLHLRIHSMSTSMCVSTYAGMDIQ